MTPEPSASPRPRLTREARELVHLMIMAERQVGNRQVAAAIEMLLLVHDRAHGIEHAETEGR